MAVRLLVVFVLSTASLAAAEPAAKESPSAVERLYRGEWSSAEQQLRRQLAERAENDDARLQLGFVQTLRAIERFAAFQWEYGARIDRAVIVVPAGALPRENPTPNRVSYPVWRRSLETLQRDLEQAEATLAAMKGDRAQFALEFAKLKWDPDSDGKPEPLMPRADLEPLRALKETNPQLEVVFDETDGIWLRGYCRLLSGSLNLMLSIDLSEVFFRFAIEGYRDPIVPEAYAKLTEEERLSKWWDSLVKLKITEPDRWHAARLDWIKVTELSESMWKSAERETDDEREWIPNPRQTGVLRFKVTPEMIDSWTAAMQESRALLEGRKLLKAWAFFGRSDEKRGVNLKRLFDDPPSTPVISFILQAPREFLEEGELSNEAVFQRLGTAFGPNAFWFGIWVN